MLELEEQSGAASDRLWVGLVWKGVVGGGEHLYVVIVEEAGWLQQILVHYCGLILLII